MKKYFFILFFAFIACDSDDGTTFIVEIQTSCAIGLFDEATGVSPPIAINVRNITTKETITAMITAREPAFDFEEVLTPTTFEIEDTPEFHVGLSERPGVYVFTIEAEGFQTIESNPILINANTCSGVSTPLLIVNLLPN